MSQIEIKADAIYSEHVLANLLGWRTGRLTRAANKDGLRVSKRGGSKYYFGSDVIDWLRAGAESHEPATSNAH